MVSWPHFLKISFTLINCGLSYSLKRDPRPSLECTKVAHQEVTNFQKNNWIFYFYFLVFQFDFESKYRFSSTFEAYYVSVASKLMFQDSIFQILNLNKIEKS